MAKITLFEFNPRGRIQIGPSGPDGEGLFAAEIDRTDEDGEETAEGDDSGLGIGAVLIPLVILAVIGVAVKVLRGGDEEEEIEMEEQEDGPISRLTSTTE